MNNDLCSLVCIPEEALRVKCYVLLTTSLRRKGIDLFIFATTMESLRRELRSLNKLEVLQL